MAGANRVSTKEIRMMNPFDSEKIWHEIVEDFRKVCRLRLTGNKKEAEAILNFLLPRRIACWARLSTYERENQEAVLRAMVKAEQREIQQRWLKHHVDADLQRRKLEEKLRRERKELESEWAVSGLVSEKVLKDMVPSVLDEIENEQAEESLQHAISQSGPHQRSGGGRIAIDNVEAMIDQLLDHQFGSRSSAQKDVFSSKPPTTSAKQPQTCNTL